MGFWKLALTGVAMTLSIRWIAAAAVIGPASFPMWGVAMVGFMAPLVIATIDLTSRFETNGGLYAWTGDAFGPFAGFLCGWIYWTCQIPFFSGLAYFILAVFAAWLHILTGSAFGGAAFVVTGAALLTLAAGLLRLEAPSFADRISGGGAVAGLVLVGLLIGGGAAVALGRGSATPLTSGLLGASLDANGAAVWAIMVFAFGGPEALAFLREEVRGGMPVIARALVFVGVALLLVYGAGTVGMLAILKPSEISRLAGVTDAVHFGLSKLRLQALEPWMLGLVLLSLTSSFLSWFGVAARLPFVVGVDRRLPAIFARRHPRTGEPVTAVWVQTGAVVAMLLLGQAGASVKAAYDFLVSMSVLSYTLPFLALFLIYLRRPTGRLGDVVSRGMAFRRIVGLAGFTAAASGVACTLVPSPDAADKAWAVAKLVLGASVLLGAGAGAYGLSLRRAAVVRNGDPPKASP